MQNQVGIRTNPQLLYKKVISLPTTAKNGAEGSSEQTPNQR